MMKSKPYASLEKTPSKRKVQRKVDERLEVRMPVFNMVGLAVNGISLNAAMLDQSNGGLTVELDVAPEIGKEVIVTFADNRRAEGRFVWYRSGKAGIVLIDSEATLPQRA
jgi:hypothetical protein